VKARARSRLSISRPCITCAGHVISENNTGGTGTRDSNFLAKRSNGATTSVRFLRELRGLARANLNAAASSSIASRSRSPLLSRKLILARPLRVTAETYPGLFTQHRHHRRHHHHPGLPLSSVSPKTDMHVFPIQSRNFVAVGEGRAEGYRSFYRYLGFTSRRAARFILRERPSLMTKIASSLCAQRCFTQPFIFNCCSFSQA